MSDNKTLLIFVTIVHATLCLLSTYSAVWYFYLSLFSLRRRPQRPL